MANLWSQAKEQFIYLLRGPGQNTSSRALVNIPQPEPPLRTSLVFESHVQEAGKGSGRNPQTISSAWDERNQWSDTQQSWQGLTAQDRKMIMLDIYLNNSAASSCVDVISKRIFSGGVHVEKVDEESPENKRSYDTLMEFLLRINADWDFMQLGRSLVADKLIFGESYAEIIWKGGLPWNLIKVDCIPMGYRANRWGQIEQFYQQLDSTRQKNWLDPENIIRWWFPHPRASIDPFAPVEKVTDAVVIDKKMMVWMMTFFRQGAKFPYHIEGASDRDEADRLQTWFLQNVMGEKNAHKLPVTWGNAKIVPTGNAGALTMDFQTGMDRMDTMVYGAFGVPPAAVSIIKVGALGGNSGEDQDKSLIYNACDPVKQAFFEKLNDRVVKRGFGITDYRISSHYADYRSDESVSKVEDTRIKNGSRTVDEIRLESGKKPYKKGGGVPFVWSTKEIVPLPRLDDLEQEQKMNAQAALDTAKAGADLAQTKAKQAKEPPVPPALQPGQQNNAQSGGGLPHAKQEKDTQGNQSAGKPARSNENQSSGALKVLLETSDAQFANGGSGSREMAGSGDTRAAGTFLASNGSQQAQSASAEDASQRLAIESQGNTGVMVALMIPPEIGQQIALPGGEPKEDLHITLAFLGDMMDVESERVVYLKAALKYFAASRQPLYGRIAGLGRFDAPDGEPTPVIALPDIPGLSALRQQLIDVLAACETPAHQNHGYTPHITLAYIDASASMPVEDIPHLSLSFDAICLVVGDERTSFPLLGQKQESAQPQYFAGKTEEPQWTADDVDQQLAVLREQGVIAVTWEADNAACGVCLMNDKVTVKLGMPFPSGHVLPLAHPNCVCKSVYLHGAQEEEDREATQKLPVVRVKQKVELTESDLWDGRS